MHKSIINININGYKRIIEFPSLCPHCHTGINPEIINISELSSLGNFGVIFLCPVCQKHIFYTYHFFNNTAMCSSLGYNTNPNLDLNIPNEIKNFSPRFEEIFKQSLTAEFYNLTEIAGIGFRKSIEFLIKDYLINIKKKDKVKISNMNLGSAFRELDDDRLKPLVTAIVWLGNDETHYLRKYENKSIEDMKKFIHALIFFIYSELAVLEAISFITPSITK